MAKAGVFIVNLQNQVREEHDISKLHRDNHYLLMLALSGRFNLILDFEEMECIAPALLCVFPEQVHHIIDDQDRQGWVISFDPSIVEEKLRQVLEKFDNPMLLDQQSNFYQQIYTSMDWHRRKQRLFKFFNALCN